MGKNPTIVSENNHSKYKENNIQPIKRRSINFAENMLGRMLGTSDKANFSYSLSHRKLLSN